MGIGVIADGIGLVAGRMDVELAGFGFVERTRAAAAEDGNLVAGFVDGTIAVDALGDGEGGTVRVRGGD